MRKSTIDGYFQWLFWHYQRLWRDQHATCLSANTVPPDFIFLGECHLQVNQVGSDQLWPFISCNWWFLWDYTLYKWGYKYLKLIKCHNCMSYPPSHWSYRHTPITCWFNMLWLISQLTIVSHVYPICLGKSSLLCPLHALALWIHTLSEKVLEPLNHSKLYPNHFLRR